MASPKPRQVKEKPTVPVDLPRDFLVTLDAFRRVHHNPPRTQIIQDAVTDMMTAELEENPGLRRKFDAIYAEMKRQQLDVVDDEAVVQFTRPGDERPDSD